MSDEYVDQLDLEIATLRGRLSGLEQARALYAGRRTFVAPSSGRQRSSWRVLIFELLAQSAEGLTSRQINDALAIQPGWNPKTINSLLCVAATRERALRRDDAGRYSIPAFVGTDGEEVVPTPDGVRQLAEFH